MFEQVLLSAAERLVNDYMAVRSGEQVLITTDTKTDQAIANVIANAAARSGARPVILLARQLPFQGGLADPFITDIQADAIKSCDVWIDLTFPYFAGSHVHDEAMKTKKVRYLLTGDLDAGGFSRLFGLVDLDQLYEAQREFDDIFIAAKGKKCRVTCPLGTDVSFELSLSGLTKSRRADKPGMYLVPGSFSIPPKVETVRGRIVVVTSFHEYYEYLKSPIVLEVDGKIKSISGGGPSRVPLERAVLRTGGGGYGSIIHFTHGMPPAARLTGGSFIEDMRTTGSNAVGLGIPWWEPGGGENHPDAVLIEQTVWIDDNKIIENGIIVGPDSLVAKANAVKPLIPAVA